MEHPDDRPVAHLVVRRWLGDAAVTVLVVLAGVAPVHPRAAFTWSTGVVVLNLVAAGALLVRRRIPRAVLLTAVVLVVASLPLGLFNPGLSVAAAVATYVVVLRVPRPQGAWVTAVVASTTLGCALLAGEAAPQHGLAVLFAGALGDAIRSQRAHVATLRERAERAERTREAVARQRVAEDRLTIARDLHDVVAHQIAVINLHAGVASSALPDRPADADASLRVIRRASRTVLTEIGDLLAALRDPGAAEGPAGLAQLDDVVREFASSGLDVTVRTDGEPRALPAAVDVAALRVVQEALANAHKHGAEHRAHLLVERLPRTLRLTVTNPVAPGLAGSVAPGNRQGLIGMGERVESVRGTLAHGPDGIGAWVLTAELPTPPADDDPADPSPPAGPTHLRHLRHPQHPQHPTDRSTPA